MSKRTSVRIPDDVYAAIVRISEREGRSVSNAIIALLKEALAAREAAKP